MPAGWADHRRAYLRFSPAYDAEYERARGLGWPVADLPGQHLHQVVAPEATAALIRRLAKDGEHPGET